MKINAAKGDTFCINSDIQGFCFMKTFLSFLFTFSVTFLSAFQSHDSKDYEKAMKEMKNNETPVVAVYIKNPKYIPPVKKYLLENKKFMEQNGKKFNFLLKH